MSVLSNLSKAHENLMYNNLQRFHLASNFLANIISASVENRNTELTVSNLTDELLPVFEKKKYANCVFLDYSAWVDTLSRQYFMIN